MKPLWTTKTFPNAFLRLIGRCVWESSQPLLLIWHAGSGLEVAFEGSAVRIVFGATPADVPQRTAHVGIWIDESNGSSPNHVVVIKKDLVVFEVDGLSPGRHRLKLLKRSEATDSTLRIHSIEIDGIWLEAPTAKPLQLEVVGASNSCGYGILGTLGQPKTTANSTVFDAFSYQAGLLLDADVSIVGASGWGVTRGYNTEGKPDFKRTLPYVYDFAGITSDGHATLDVPWNHEKNQYHAVILNMGSNDFNASGYFQQTQEEQAVMRVQFQNDYRSFLKHVRETHPNAWIICTYGMSNEKPHFTEMYETIGKEADRELGNVLAIPMHAAGSMSQPFATDYHPNAAIHKENAILLAQWITKLVLDPQKR